MTENNQVLPKLDKLDSGSRMVMLDHEMESLEQGRQDLEDHRRWTNSQLGMSESPDEVHGLPKMASKMLTLGDVKNEIHYHYAAPSIAPASQPAAVAPHKPSVKSGVAQVAEKPAKGLLKKLMPAIVGIGLAGTGAGAAIGIPMVIDALTSKESVVAPVVEDRFKVILER